MTDKEGQKLEYWLMDHMSEYIMKRAEAHRYIDAHPDKKLPEKLYEYDDNPRWLYEALIALLSLLHHADDKVIADVAEIKELDLLPVILKMEPQVQNRIDMITTLKKEQK